MPTNAIVSAIKLLVGELTQSDLVSVLQAELGKKNRLGSLVDLSKWIAEQLPDSGGDASSRTLRDGFGGLDQDAAFMLLQDELGKDERLGLLQSIVDWAVPDKVYAPSKAITDIRFRGTVTSYDVDVKVGWIDCAEAKEIFGEDVLLEGSQIRKGARVNDQLEFAILRDSSDKPQAFDIVNETLIEKEEERRERFERKGSGKGEKGERRGKGRRKRERADGEEEDNDDEEGGRRRRREKGKGRKRQRKGDGEHGEKGEGRGEGKGQWKERERWGERKENDFSQKDFSQARQDGASNTGNKAGVGSFAQLIRAKWLKNKDSPKVVPPNTVSSGPIAPGKKAETAEDNICWNFKNGKCSKGAECLWVHA